MPFSNQLSVLFSNLDIFLEPYNNLQHSHPWKKNIFIFFGRCNSYPGCNLIHQTNLRHSMKDKCIDWIHWMTNHGQIINIFGQNTFKQTVLSYLLIMIVQTVLWLVTTVMWHKTYRLLYLIGKKYSIMCVSHEVPRFSAYADIQKHLNDQ